jgi:hypothetical protein
MVNASPPSSIIVSDIRQPAMLNTEPPAHPLPVHAAALREAAERRTARARAQRDLVVASLLRCPDRSPPSRRS